MKPISEIIKEAEAEYWMNHPQGSQIDEWEESKRRDNPPERLWKQ